MVQTSITENVRVILSGLWAGRLAGAFLALVFLISTLAPAIVPASAQVTVPDDFSIRLESRARGVDEQPAGTDGPPPDIAWVEIDASGKVKTSAMIAKRGLIPPTTLNLSKQAIANIYAITVQERFFKLDPVYRDPAIQGGDLATMTITANGKTYTVTTINIRVYAFDRITLTIDKELPIERRIQYNALHVKEYKTIER